MGRFIGQVTAVLRQPDPRLFGLVVAGGTSVRMGRDKGLISYAGSRAVDRAVGLLVRVCDDVFVSVRASQSTEPAYSRYPLIIDRHDDIGPMESLLAAFAHRADCAWLALAVDMLLVDTCLLDELVAARDANKLATAFRNEAGIPEPLCTVWEPRAATVLRERHAAGRHSLRAVLESEYAGLVSTARSSRLVSVNTPVELASLPDAAG